jgi:hypothetical protein
MKYSEELELIIEIMIDRNTTLTRKAEIIYDRCNKDIFPQKKYKPINIVFDGPPGPTAGRFIEVEDDNGYSINCGEWINKGKYWHLRIWKLPE